MMSFVTLCPSGHMPVFLWYMPLALAPLFLMKIKSI